MARLLAVKASVHSQYDADDSLQKAEDLFSASARLIEAATLNPSQQTAVPNTMAASQLIWKHWSSHWERKFNREFEEIWKNNEFNGHFSFENLKICFS